MSEEWPGQPVQPDAEKWPGTAEQGSAMAPPKPGFEWASQAEQQGVHVPNTDAGAYVSPGAPAPPQTVLHAFGEGFDEAFQPDKPFGFSKETQDWVNGLDQKSAALAPLKWYLQDFVAPAAAELDRMMRVAGGLQHGIDTAGEAAIGVPPFQAGMDIGAATGFMPLRLSPPKPFVKPSPIKPIEGSPAGPLLRSEAAKTGVPEIDAVLDHPTVKAVIDNAVPDRSHTIPYEAGGSVPLDNPTTYIDEHVPGTFTAPRLSDPAKTVTFDTAEPTVIHENVEEFTMGILIRGGMKPEEAYRAAHFGWAQPAEHAWYLAHDIDPDAVETQWKKLQPGIQHEIAEDAPPDLYKKEYPGGSVTAARHEDVFEAPASDEEIARAREIVRNAPELQGAGPMLAKARELGVIGEERPPVSEGTPAEAGRNALPPKPPQEPPRPGEPGGPPETPEMSAWRKRLIATLDKMETPEQMRAAVLDSVDRNGEFKEARQGKLSEAAVRTLADVTGVDSYRIDPEKTGAGIKSSDQMRAIVEAFRSIQDRMRQLAEHSAGLAGENAAAAREELVRLELQHAALTDAVVEPFVAFRAEFGRAGNVMQEFMKVKREGADIDRFVRERLGRSTDEQNDIARMIAATPKEDIPKALADLRKPPGAWYWTWVQGLISGIVTHTKYVAANKLFALTQHGLVTPVAAVVGKLKELAGWSQDDERVFMRETLSGLGGHFGSMPAALMASARAVKSNVKVTLESEKELFDRAVERNKALIAAGEKPEPIPLPLQRANEVYSQAEPENFKIVPFTDPQRWFNVAARRLVGLPGRSANGIHTFFKIMGEQSSLAQQATRKAIAEGLQPDADNWTFEQRQAYWRANPTDKMLEQATKDGYYATFMQDLGPAGKAWQRATRVVPGLRWLFPFNHIPVNILKAGVEHSPFAFAGPEMRANLLGKNGSIAQDKAIARMVVGSSIMGFFAYKYLNGQATGDFPTDPHERAAWKLEGKQPNSLLIGNTWWSMDKFGPAGSLANLGANFGSVWEKYRAGDDDAYSGAAWKAAEAAGHFVSDEVGFQGLANIMEALHDENRAVSLAATTAATAMPFSSLLSQTASISDPNMREVRTFLDGLRYRTPVLRKTLLPKRDWAGEPIPNPQYGSIIRRAQANPDPVDRELVALGKTFGHFPAPPGDYVAGVKLPPALHDRYQTIAGPLTRAQLEAFVTQPGWADQPAYVRDQIMRDTIRRTRQAAAARLMMEHPEIVQQGIANRQSAIAGQKPGQLPQ